MIDDTPVWRKTSRPMCWSSVAGYQYTESDARCGEYREQSEAARRLGLNAEYTEQVPISMAACGYRIADMARFDCVAYLHELAARVTDLGGRILAGTPVESPSGSSPTLLRAGDHEVRFNQVVTATHCHFGGALHLYAGLMMLAASPWSAVATITPEAGMNRRPFNAWKTGPTRGSSSTRLNHGGTPNYSNPLMDCPLSGKPPVATTCIW